MANSKSIFQGTFEELKDRFDSLLVKYKDVCVRLRKMESCGAPAEEKEELVWEEYILRGSLIRRGRRIHDLTGSDKEKRDMLKLCFKVVEMMPASVHPAVGLAVGLVDVFLDVIDYLEANGEPRVLGEERSKYEKY